MTEAKLPRGLCWLSAGRHVGPGVPVLIVVRNNTGRPLLIDAIYVDAPSVIVTSIVFPAEGERLPAPVPVASLNRIGRPRLLPVLVVRGSRCLHPTMEIGVTVTHPLGPYGTTGERVEVLIRCRDPEEIDPA